MARRREGSTGTPATLALERAGIAYTTHAYAHDPRAASYGLEAAEALGVDPAEVFKTLVVDTGSALAVAVVPVAGRLDLKALGAVLGAKRVALADPAAAQRSSGYVPGGISPVGHKRPLVTVIDESARALERMYVSGGRRGLDLALSPADLARVTGARWAAVAAP